MHLFHKTRIWNSSSPASAAPRPVSGGSQSEQQNLSTRKIFPQEKLDNDRHDRIKSGKPEAQAIA
jgi:hypothetical protein